MQENVLSYDFTLLEFGQKFIDAVTNSATKIQLQTLKVLYYREGEAAEPSLAELYLSKIAGYTGTEVDEWLEKDEESAKQADYI